jgi:ethanolamine utilization microcompartment shell protein EutS
LGDPGPEVPSGGLVPKVPGSGDHLAEIVQHPGTFVAAGKVGLECDPLAIGQLTIQILG